MSERNPWKTLRSREIYRNKWVRLREDDVIRPDGTKGIYSVLELPPSVGIVALDDTRRILLVGQWRYANGRYSWEIPTGGCNAAREPRLRAAKRELAEETGLTAKIWLSLGEIQNSNGATSDIAHLFLARNLKPGATAPEAMVEGIATKWVPFQTAFRKVMSGEITESCSVAGILKTDLFLRKRPKRSSHA
jgi:8-oxo-dGTP pyrophosphatase MutT (NUDIX family)